MSAPRPFGSLGDDRQTGVYRIRCTETGKVYVGSAATSFGRRWDVHRADLRRGKHHSRYLQRAWNKYGPLYFVFEVLERTAPEHAVAVEQTFIDLSQSADPKYGYNISPTAGSCLGVKHTAEARAKMLAANSNPSAETRAKMSLAHKVRASNPDVRDKMSLVRLGKKHTPETRAKISASAIGKSPTPETRAKLSKIHKGRTITDEWRAKISATTKGRIFTNEHLANISRTKLLKAAAAWGDYSKRRKWKFMYNHNGNTPQQALAELVKMTDGVLVDTKRNLQGEVDCA